MKGVKLNAFPILFLLICCVIILLCVQLWLRYRRIFRIMSKMHFLPSYPFIGSPEIVFNKLNIMDILTKISNREGDNYGFWYFHKFFVVVLRVEDIKKVFLSPYCSDKGYLYDQISRMVGNGLISNGGQQHKKMRKFMKPAFYVMSLRSFIPIFNEESVRMIDEILPQFNGKVAPDWYQTFALLAVDVVRRTLFGLNNDSKHIDSLPSQTLVDSFDIGQALVYKRANNLFLQPEIFFRLTKLTRSYDEAKKAIADYTTKMVDYNMRRVEESRKKFLNADDKTEVFRGIAEVLIRNDSQTDLKKYEIVDECRHVLIGGLETSSISLCNFLTFMGMYQDIQAKVYEEIMDVVGPDKLPDMDDLPKLEYLERCIKESLRLIPPVINIFRSVTGKGIELSNSTIPAGATIAINIEYVLRSPEYWDEPDEFNPDRFLPDESAKRHPCAFIPFSGGSRGCIGEKYSFMLQKCALVSIMRKYKSFCKKRNINEIEMYYSVVSRIKKYDFYLEPRK